MRAVSIFLLLGMASAISLRKHAPKKMFCFSTVQSEPEKTFASVRHQFEACDGFAFYSNFADVSQSIHKATNRSMVTATESYGMLPGQGGGSANRDIFVDVWNHIAEKEHGYDWYVKVDPDTLLRPTKLRKILGRFKSNEPLVLSDDMDNKPTGVLGSLYVLSSGALDTYRSKTKDCEANVNSQFEDQYMEYCMKRHQVKIEHPTGDNGNNLFAGGKSSNFLLTRETAYWPELKESDFRQLANGAPFCIKDYILKIRVGKRKCFSHDVAAIHPIKDPKMMALAVELFGQ